jgi:hypothetical protein
MAGVGAALLLAFAEYGQIETIRTTSRIAFADEQTTIFEEMLEKVEHFDPEEAVKCLSYVHDYYPSGTKQVADSPLDRVVERARRNTVREIIAILCTKTGRDFGDDPRRWEEGIKNSKVASIGSLTRSVSNQR